MQKQNQKLKNCIYIGLLSIAILFHSCDSRSKSNESRNLIIDNDELFAKKDKFFLENYLNNSKRIYNVVVLVERKCTFDKEIYSEKALNQFAGKFHSDKIVLFYFLIDEKSVVIKTSKLLELSDDTCADILGKIMNEFRNENFSIGVIKGLELIDLELKKVK